MSERHGVIIDGVVAWKVKQHGKSEIENSCMEKSGWFCVVVAVVMARAPRDSRNVETKHQPINLTTLSTLQSKPQHQPACLPYVRLLP